MTDRTRTGIVVFILAQGLTLTGCGDSRSRSTPSAPSSVLQPASPFTSAVNGKVVDTADRPISGALVEVVGGSQAGMSVTSTGNGEFYFAGSFDDATVFRASREGYTAATQSWRRVSPGQPYLLFYLGVLAPPVSIAGNYTLTFIAADACAAALPADLRSRTYAATITARSPPNVPADTRLTIEASGAEFDAYFNWFSVGVAGDYLAFWLGDEHLIEKLGADRYLELMGSAEAVTTSGASTISASFSGTFRYSGAPACISGHHQLVLTRR